MLFAFTGLDKPDSLQLRTDTRPPHLEFLTKTPDGIVVRLASPRLNEEGKPIGSLVVIEAPDKASAEAFFASDPYAKVDLFQATSLEALADVAFDWPK